MLKNLCHVLGGLLFIIVLICGMLVISSQYVYAKSAKIQHKDIIVKVGERIRAYKDSNKLDINISNSSPDNTFIKVLVQLDDANKTIVYQSHALNSGDALTDGTYLSTDLAIGKYNAYYIIQVYDSNDVDSKELLCDIKKPVTFEVVSSRTLNTLRQ